LQPVGSPTCKLNIQAFRKTSTLGFSRYEDIFGARHPDVDRARINLQQRAPSVFLVDVHPAANRAEGMSMSAARERLPNRRPAETFDLEALGLKFRATIGRHDGKVGEVFLSNHRVNSQAGIMASDAAVLCSIALQMGASPEALLHSLMKDSAGRATSPIGVVLEMIVGEART
jgi:hypothetical protein